MNFWMFVDKHAGGIGFLVFLLAFLLFMAWSDR